MSAPDIALSETQKDDNRGTIKEDDFADLEGLDEEGEESAVVLHEDKSYYKDASQVFAPGIDVAVHYEDKEGIDKPLWHQ